jgi:hypothetical protein
VSLYHFVALSDIIVVTMHLGKHKVDFRTRSLSQTVGQASVSLTNWAHRASKLGIRLDYSQILVLDKYSLLCYSLTVHAKLLLSSYAFGRLSLVYRQ